jgi:hypothetical protein
MSSNATQVRRVTVTPVTDTAAFATGDQIGTLQTVNELLAADGMGSILTMVNITDKAKQSVALDLIFYNLPVTLVGAENAAADVSDAELAASYLGHVNIVAADYTILNANSAATKAVRIPLHNKGRSSDAVGGVIPRHRVYMQIVSRGAPTYAGGATGDLAITLTSETDA